MQGDTLSDNRGAVSENMHDMRGRKRAVRNTQGQKSPPPPRWDIFPSENKQKLPRHDSELQIMLELGSGGCPVLAGLCALKPFVSFLLRAAGSQVLLLQGRQSLGQSGSLTRPPRLCRSPGPGRNL